MKGKSKVYLSAIGVWFVLLVVAFTLGAVRELALNPLIGEPGAHIVGTLAVVVAFLGIMAYFVRRVRDGCSTGDFWLIGLLWLAMTASFEFLFFHFVGGKPWEELLADYNVAQGRIWVLVLLTTLLGPGMAHGVLLGRSSHVILIRVVHTALAIVFLFCLLHVYVSGLTGVLSPWVLFSVGLLLLEGVVLLVNRGDCPLSSLQRKYGDAQGFFGLFLPPRLLPYVIPVFAVLTLAGLLLLATAFLQS